MPSSCRIKDFAVVEFRDGPSAVCVDFWGAVWMWNPRRDLWRERPLADAFGDDPSTARGPLVDNDIDKVAVTVCDGRVVLAGGGDEQGVALWDLESGERLRGTNHEEPESGSVAAVRGAGPALFVTGSQYVGQLLVWDAAGRTPPEELPYEGDDIVHLAAAWIDGRALAAVGEAASSGVEVWDLVRKEQVASPYPDDEAPTVAVSVARLGDGRPVAVSASESALFVWDLTVERDPFEGDEPMHEPMTGHEAPITAMDTVEAGDRLLAVTGAEDGTVRIWNLTEGTQVGDPLTGHRGGVDTVRAGFDGTAFSAGRDGTVCVWDLRPAIA